MKWIKRILLALLLLIVVVAIGVAVIFNRWTRGPLPQTSGEITVAGLTAPVEVIRDSWGIPQIYADNTHDLFFAQGYTHAQDRWWQMEFARHVGAGRLQELTGQTKSLMGTDIFIRTAGWYAAAQRDWEVYDEATKAVLQAFADGVNAYINSRDKSALAFEYNLLGVTGVKIDIAPWTPVDSLVWGKVMAWNLGNNRDQELIRSTLYAQIGQEMADTILSQPWPYGEKPTILHSEDIPISDATLSNPATVSNAGVVGVDTVFAGGITASSPIFAHDTSIGSNNWVIGGKLTTTGKPLLANDPHLGIQMPSIWYEIGLHCRTVSAECPFDVTGFALPAIAGVVIGHNDRIAWGVTNVGPDTQDMYLIKVNPDNELQYEWDGAWRDMTIREEVINFGDGEPSITVKVRETHLGPILNDNNYDSETGKVGGFNNTDPMVLHWTTTAEISTLATAVLKLDQAQNWEDFRTALSFWDSPSQNVIYADVDGNIGYQTPGNIPIRAAGHSGMLPIDGTTSQYEWKGYIPFDDLPRILNPERGYIATANQAVTPPEYTEQLAAKLGATYGADSNYNLGFDWDYGYRAQRIEAMMAGLAPHSIESIIAMQGDNKNINAEEVLPYLDKLDIGSLEANQLRDWLLDWDYQMSLDSQQGGLYAYFWRALVRNIYADELGDDSYIGVGSDAMWATHQLLALPDHAWWDDSSTADKTETRDEILIRAFQQAVDEITKDRGAKGDKWAWGQIHTSTFVSNPLGLSGISLIEDMVNAGPYQTAGGPSIVNATSWGYGDGPEAFAVRALPSMRFIADLGNFANDLTMHTTGESGHPFSPHYKDMIDSWRTIQYHPQLWTPDQVAAAKVDSLILKPS